MHVDKLNVIWQYRDFIFSCAVPRLILGFSIDNSEAETVKLEVLVDEETSCIGKERLKIAATLANSSGTIKTNQTDFISKVFTIRHSPGGYTCSISVMDDTRLIELRNVSCSINGLLISASML